MTKYQITNPQGKTKTYSSKRAAEEAADALPGDITVEPVEPEAGGGDYAQAATEHAEATVEGAAYTPPQPDDTRENEPVAVEGDAGALDQLGEELGTDPLEILPEHMIDHIQGQPAVNKRGYAMIAERYNIAVETDVVAFPWDNSEGRAVAKATATTDDGREYTGYGTACAGDGDMDDQLIELADTRAAKRALAWASGVGIVSYQELSGELEQ